MFYFSGVGLNSITVAVFVPCLSISCMTTLDFKWKSDYLILISRHFIWQYNCCPNNNNAMWEISKNLMHNKKTTLESLKLVQGGYSLFLQEETSEMTAGLLLNLLCWIFLNKFLCNISTSCWCKLIIKILMQCPNIIKQVHCQWYAALSLSTLSQSSHNDISSWVT